MTARREVNWGRLMIAAGLLGFGALTLLYDDFGLDWQRVPDWVPGRGLLAYAAGAIEVAAAAALLFERTSALAAFVLTPYTLLWVLLLDVPPLLAHLRIESAWLSVGERTELFAGVWILAVSLARAQNRAGLKRFSDDRALQVARVIFGLALIPVGLSHLVYPDAVALVPAWLPFRAFWLAATGIGHMAAGLALIVSVLPRLAAIMEAAMMTSFVLLVHVPRVFASPHDRTEWTMLCIATAFSGAAWCTARSYRTDPWKGEMTMNRRTPLLAAIALLFPFAGLAHAQDSGGYKVVRIQLVGGDGGFDYVTADPDGRNLYVARSGPAGHIGVFNLDTLAQVADIPGVSAHGGAVDTATGHGFATSMPVTMFDAKTFAVLKRIDVQGNPDGYLNDPYNHRFYILSHSEPNITILDDRDGAILGTIDIGGAPEQAATDGHGRIYVDIEDKAAIAVIDAGNMKMVGRYDLSGKGAGCAGLALDAKNQILFAACREQSNLIILSAKDGHIITALPTGVGCDGVTFNPATMEAFSSQGDGTLTVVKEDSPTSFHVEQTVATPQRAKTLTLDPKTNQIYLITAEYGPAPAVSAQAAPPSPGVPDWLRRPRPPMIPHSFQILVVGH